MALQNSFGIDYYKEAMKQEKVMAFVIAQAWIDSSNCWQEMDWATGTIVQYDNLELVDYLLHSLSLSLERSNSISITPHHTMTTSPASALGHVRKSKTLSNNSNQLAGSSKVLDPLGERCI